jgi:hypothetical protein
MNERQKQKEMSNYYHYRLVIFTNSPREQDHSLVAQLFYESTPDWTKNVLRPLPRPDSGTFQHEGEKFNKWKTELFGECDEGQAAFDKFSASIEKMLEDSRCKKASTIVDLKVFNYQELVYERTFNL